MLVSVPVLAPCVRDVSPGPAPVCIGNRPRSSGRPKVVPPKKKLTAPASLKAPDTLRDSLSKMIKEVLGSFTAVAFNGAQILVVLVTLFFALIFMLMNPRPIVGAILALFTAPHHQQVVTILQRIGKFVPMWAGATLLGMITIGMLVFMLMWPIFGFMDALVLGLFACVMEAIPFLGPILSAVPALLLAVGKGGLTPLCQFRAWGWCCFIKPAIKL